MPTGPAYGGQDPISTKTKDKSIQPSTKANRIVVDLDAEAAKGSSAYNRKGKKGIVGLDLLNFTPHSSDGFMAGVYMDPDTILDASYVRLRWGELGYPMKSDAFGIRLKNFLGNSFYWRAGVVFRTIDYDTWAGRWVTPGNKIVGNIKVSSLGADVAIGNQWQWETFMMGGDWIGLLVPLIAKYEISKPANATDAWYEYHKKEAASAAKKVDSQFRFYLGISF